MVTPAVGTKSARPSPWRVWVTAARPHTITASVSPCLVAYASCRPSWDLFLAWLVFCITVQIGTNLHNDYSDFVQGADDVDTRVGHARATAQGWWTPAQTCRASVGVLSVTFASGVYLAVATGQTKNAFFWFLVLSSIFNAFAYTGGPFPLGYIGLGSWSLAYSGLGDLFVLLYFGYVAILMLPYLLYRQGQEVAWPAQWRYGTQVGLLAVTILIVNNLRDRHTDQRVHKRTTAVRFGRRFSLVQYYFCILVSYLLVLVDAFQANALGRLLPLLSLPLAARQLVAVGLTEGAALNPYVGGSAQTQLFFAILLACSLQW
jgi:1,4-dihydroxy-2-naphthoate octaprenyltransferase